MAPLLLGIGAVAASATLFACLFRFRSVVSFVLAAYLIAWTEIVAVVLALSAAGWVDRWNLVVAFVVLGAIALGVWLAASCPRPPSVFRAAHAAAGAARDPLVALPLVTSALALAYTFVAAVSTAPNDGDPLAYELTRAAFWRQEGGIVNLDAAYKPLDFWPPVAEMGDLVILTLSGSERAPNLLQWLAVPMLVLATYGVARRVGLERAPALWSASIVPTLPVVLAQSWASFTDLVFASFAVSAVYFGLGTLGLELIPVGLAVGLALGTKFVGPILSPLFLLVLALGQPRRRWLAIAAAALTGAAVASLWYLRTLLEEGDPIGNGGGGIQSREIGPVVTTFARLSAEVFDLSGAPGRDAWLYVLVAVVVALGGLSLLTRRRTDSRSLLIGGLAIAVVPVVVSVLGKAYARVGLEVGELVGRADLVDQLRGWEVSRVSDGAFSWFGPIGTALALASVPIAIVEWRRRRLARAGLALAVAPIVALGLVSLAVSYQRYQGRYFVAAFALSAAVWGGFALRHRWVGTAVAGTAAATVVLVFVNSLGKPSGIGLFRGDPGRSVWSMPRWEQQGILRSTPPERDEVMTMRFVEEQVPADASIGISLAYNSFGFPYFGRSLERKLAIVDSGETVPTEVDWLVASPGQTVRGCRDAWSRERRGPYGWTVWKRVADDACVEVAPL